MTLEELKAKAEAAGIAAREARRAYETALCEKYPLKPTPYRDANGDIDVRAYNDSDFVTPGGKDGALLR